MMRTERERGVTLRLLDLSSVEAEATKAKGKEGTRMKTGFGPYALAEHDGKTYVVCSEGVGWEVSDEKPFELDLYEHTESDKGTSFSIMPTLLATMSLVEVREAATDETVDLADFVRSFGARLESNFRLWHSTLGGG